MPGGLGDPKVADDTVHSVVKSVKEDLKSKVLEKRGSNSAEFELTPVSYKTQVVAGTNFFVKVSKHLKMDQLCPRFELQNTHSFKWFKSSQLYLSQFHLYPIRFSPFVLHDCFSNF